MRQIVKILRTQTITTKDNRKITLYFYDIGHGDIVKTPQKFKVGDKVEAWFNAQYDEIRIRKRRDNE